VGSYKDRGYGVACVVKVWQGLSLKPLVTHCKTFKFLSNLDKVVNLGVILGMHRKSVIHSQTATNSWSFVSFMKQAKNQINLICNKFCNKLCDNATTSSTATRFHLCCQMDGFSFCSVKHSKNLCTSTLSPPFCSLSGGTEDQ